jgi:hypothetical protein
MELEETDRQPIFYNFKQDKNVCIYLTELNVQFEASIIYNMDGWPILIFEFNLTFGKNIPGPQGYEDFF